MNPRNPFPGTTLFVAILALLPVLANAQVSISPTAVFLNDQSPYANVVVANGSEQTQEISITFDFGYSVSDEAGNVSIRYLEEDEEDPRGAHEQSMSEYLNAFPRNFTLDPGGRQTVRLAVRGYGSLSDGTYWSRVRILASPLSPPLEAAADEEVAARININFEQVIPAFFRMGDTSTGIQIREVVFDQQENESGHFLLHLERSGNSPFVGRVLTEVFDDDGAPVYENISNLSVYYDLHRRISLPADDLQPGDYNARFTIETRRRDISSRHLLQTEPVRTDTNFRIE